MKEHAEPIEYYPGIFDIFKNNSNLDEWCESFPDVMCGLGFDLAPPDALNEALKESGIKIKEATNKHEEYRNLL